MVSDPMIRTTKWIPRSRGDYPNREEECECCESAIRDSFTRLHQKGYTQEPLQNVGNHETGVIATPWVRHDEPPSSPQA